MFEEVAAGLAAGENATVVLMGSALSAKLLVGLVDARHRRGDLLRSLDPLPDAAGTRPAKGRSNALALLAANRTHQTLALFGQG